MRLLILSDIHIEQAAAYQTPPGLEYDIVVFAGEPAREHHGVAPEYLELSRDGA